MESTEITANTNHAGVQNLLGWSLRSADAVINFRAKEVTGAILATINCAEAGVHQVELERALDAREGTYVQVVSGTLDGGVLWHT